uniref:Cytosol aminopeptidase domain-containing protein n=1 Tax=Meloidogyne javanica TaxID=6303 RepID=A0A915LCJ1_MELJA
MSSTLQINLGLNLERKLPDTQIVILGRKKFLKGLEFEKNQLSKKLEPLVGNDLFKKAINQIETNGGSVPLYLDLAKIVSVSDDISRHNTPSNAYAITREVKAIKSIKGIKNLSILLFCDFSNIMASCAAIARAFPLFSLKTTKSGYESIEIELVLPNEEEKPTDSDIKFLQYLCANIRECCRLVDTPADILHTEVLFIEIGAFLDEALSQIEQTGKPVTKTIIKGEELKEKGFGGIYSVGRASLHPPIFACFSYIPEGKKDENSSSYALVGKGIVYDTGGLSLKGKTLMPTMKIDMAGAAGVLGAFCTLVKAGFNQPLHCLLCIAENHISPTATRPDDIIKLLSGKTVEVNNTDAEGRLVLADGVFYAKETLKAKTIIDMATLTGFQPMTTGRFHAAILSNCEQLENECVIAGKKSGELVHPLPFSPELHFSDMSSKVADMKNACLGVSSGPPTALAGLFIGTQIDYGETKSGADWLHIDMCGLTALEK